MQAPLNAMHANTPLKYPGGKRWQVETLAPLFARYPDRRYVEPFCGACGMALGIGRRTAWMNDTNAHMINFFQQVQRGLHIEIPMENDSDLYYRHRERFNTLIRGEQAMSAEGASLLYYLNRTGFNGMMRYNKQGLFNIPFGTHRTITYQRTFNDTAAAIADWAFTCGDFEAMTLDPSDVLYCDPPYDTPFTTYSAGGFAWADQERLVRWLVRHPGPVVLVNQATPRIEALYRDAGFTLTYLDAPRRVSCTGDRTPAREVIAMKCAEDQP